MMTLKTITVLLGLGAFMAATAASADEVTIKGVAAFPEGTIYAQKFEEYISRVNERGKGLVQIDYIGGAPKVMPLFEVGKNLKDGIIDIAITAGSYYSNVLPEAEAMKLIEVPMSELRESGGFDLINRLHIEKANTQYIARMYNYEQGHIYLTKPIDEPDLSGMKVRVTAMYRALVEGLGATAINTTPQEVFTLLERGAVDGYGWASRGIFDYSWEGLTKYRIDPGFYHIDISLVANHDTWTKTLNDEQRKLLTDIALEMEADTSDEALVQAELRRQEAAGIIPIVFTGEDREKYLQIARDGGWKVVEEVAPDTVDELRKYFTGLTN